MFDFMDILFSRLFLIKNEEDFVRSEINFVAVDRLWKIQLPVYSSKNGGHFETPLSGWQKKKQQIFSFRKKKTRKTMFYYVPAVVKVLLFVHNVLKY